jgi:Tfp pilus assembly protein PilX
MSRRLRSEGGFAMATVMGVLMVVSLASVAAFAATTGDIRSGTDDVQRKQAYAAAEAGLQAYAYQLSLDADLWSRCDQVSSTGLIVNQRVAPNGARQWSTLPGSSAQYALEILPANGASSCDPNNSETVFDTTSGTFRIRSTGRARAGAPRVSLIATFRKPSFADYVYFTDSEGGNIRFVTGDQVNGPLHTNDALLICGSPKFGRSPADNIEVVKPGAGNGWSADANCAGSAPQVNFPPSSGNGSVGTWRYPSANLQLPQSNAALKADAASAYRFLGETRITFNSGGTMTVTGKREDGVTYNNTTVGMPPNGVIYVSNETCPGAYDINDPYNTSRTGPGKCGTAWVQGTYSKSVTVGAESDIVVMGSLVRSGNVVAGLISNNWIRVYRPTTRSGEPQPRSCANGERILTSQSGNWPPAPGTLTIDAAILSLSQRFGVDNYWCDRNSRPTLNVRGAIAQKTRGAVGTSGPTGYIKNYVYDDRLRYRTPPSFLDPVSSAWQVTAQQEQVPAQ